MKITIRHRYPHSPEKVWPALRSAVIGHPEIAGKKIVWEDKKAEGKYAGSAITLSVSDQNRDYTEIEVPFSLQINLGSSGEQ